MIEAARDWFEELKTATTIEEVEELARQIRENAPHLRDPAWFTVTENWEGGEEWADALFKKPGARQDDTNQKKLLSRVVSDEDEVGKILKLPTREREAKLQELLDARRNGNGGLPDFNRLKNPSGWASSMDNALKAVDGLKIECRYDEFHDRIIVHGHEEDGAWDHVLAKVRQKILGRFGFDPEKHHVHDALVTRCLDHRFDPVRDYLDGLVWDGQKRLDTWLVKYCGAADTPLNRAIGRKMLVAGVRRVRSPGCKFDHMAIFEGPQGIGKSTVLLILAGAENFSDAEIIGLDKQEQQEALQGVWIYEVGELEGMRKSEVTSVKLLASKTHDRARPAYGRRREDRPRRGILVGTTNENEYLKDATGNRRFWPVPVAGVIVLPNGKKLIDLEELRRNRDQLWAEAAKAEANGEELELPRELSADIEEEQDARREVDPWDDVVGARLGKLSAKAGGSNFCLAADAQGDPEWPVSSDFLLTDVLSIPKERQNTSHARRLAAIMRRLGWTKPEQSVRIGGVVARGYVKGKGVEGNVTDVTVTTGALPTGGPCRDSTSSILNVTSVTSVTSNNKGSESKPKRPSWRRI
jgi:predicted P-loop ATPase